MNEDVARVRRALDHFTAQYACLEADEIAALVRALAYIEELEAQVEAAVLLARVIERSDAADDWTREDAYDFKYALAAFRAALEPATKGDTR